MEKFMNIHEYKEYNAEDFRNAYKELQEVRAVA